MRGRLRRSAYQEHYEVEDRHWWFNGRWAVVQALLSKVSLPADPLILDAGCGTGGNLRRYSTLGRVEGVEPMPDAVELCRQRGFEAVTEAGLEDLPLEDARYDLVAATDVLEHIEAEREALRELRRVTAPNGVLLLTVPAYMWLWTPEDDNLHHKRRYTLPRLREAVESCGWETAFATYFNTFLLPPIAAVRLLGKRRRSERADLDRTPAWLNGPLSVPMRTEAALIRAGVRLPAGVSVGIVCRKAD